MQNMGRQTNSQIDRQIDKDKEKVKMTLGQTDKNHTKFNGQVAFEKHSL